MLGPLLLLSLVGLAIGPLLAAVGRGRAVASAAIDGLGLGVIPVLILTRLLPHTFEELGGFAVALAAAGFAVVSFGHRRGHAAEDKLGRAVVLPTLALHALGDGAGLALSVSAGHGGESGVLLGAALVLHRLPEGLFIARAFGSDAKDRRTALRRVAWPVLVLSLATAIGAWSGRALLEIVPEALFDGFVAFGLGAMLRVVVHTHDPHLEPSRSSRAASGAAFVAGIALALAIPAPDSVLAQAQPRELSIVQSLGPLFVETAPSILVGLLAAGVVHAFLPRHPSSWLRARSRIGQAARGMVFGLPLPICSCGVLPMARRLFLVGAPTAAVVSFAIATPALGIDSAILSLRLLGPRLTLVRIVVCALVALIVALAVSALVRSTEDSIASFGAVDEPGGARAPSFGRRAREALREGFGETLDHTGAWYVLGLLAAASFEAFVDPSLVARLGAPLDVAATAVAAIPVYVCAQGATPLAAVMVHKGFSVGAALAFLVVGPATNLGILGVLRRHVGLRGALGFALVSLAAAIGLGLLANRLVDPRSLPEIHPLVAHDHHPAEWAATALLASLLLASMLRLGARGWVGSLAAEGARDHDDDHGHGHGHDHDHDHDQDHDHGHDRHEGGASHEEERRGLAHEP